VRRAVWFLLPLLAVALWALLTLQGDPAVPQWTARSGDGSQDIGVVVALPAVASDPSVPQQRSGADSAEPAVAALLAATDTGYCGRVVSRQGEPVAGIGVQLLRVSPDLAMTLDLDVFARTPAAPELIVGRTVTDDRGRFGLLGVTPRGWCGLRLAFSEVDAAPARWRSGQGTFLPVQQSPQPGEVVDLGDVVLKTGATLVGRVVGGDGPIAGALVRAARLPPLPFAAVPIERLRADGALVVTAVGQQAVLPLPEWFGRVLDLLPIAHGLSAADGTFVLYGVDPGDVVVAATAPAHDSLLRHSIHTEGGMVTSLGDLQLADGSTAEVLVEDRAGEPVVGAEVLVAPCSVGIPVHIGERAGMTNAAGKVVMDGLPRGRAMAAARVPPDGAWQLGEPGSSDGTLRVVIPARHSLLLTVQDGAGKPIPDATVRALPGVADRGAVELAMFGFGEAADLGRRLERLEDGRLRLRDLDDGAWTFVIGAAGCSAQSLDVDLREDLQRTVVMKVARALRVRTIDAEGEPVANATLHVTSRGGSRTDRIVELPLAVGRTDVEGWCAVRDLPTDSARLTASHRLHGQVHASIEGHPSELVLQFAAAATIRGVLTDGGRPPAPGRWVLVLERRYENAPNRDRGAMPDLPQLALPSLDGSFTFGALQPGKYRVTAQDAMTDVGTIAGIMQYAAHREQILPWNKAEIELHGGEVANVRLDAILDAAAYDGPGAAVRGVVVIDGVPAFGAVVVGSSKSPQRRVTSRVDRGGAFDLGRCPAGEIRVVVVPSEVAESRLKENLFSHQYARDLQVVPEQPLDLHIDIATGEVFGEVRDASGAVVDDCRIVLFDRGGDRRSSSLRVGHTDARGSFAFPSMPSGTYELRAEKSGRGKVTLRSVAVLGRGSLGPIAVVLVPMVEVEGRIETLPGTRAEVELAPAAGGDPNRATTEPGGAFRIPEVPIGRYRVRLRVPVGTPWRSGGDLEVVEPATRSVVLRAGS
jgi:hypothetical protein